MPLFLSRFLKIVLILVGIFILFIIFFPSLLSTDWGREQTLRVVNSYIPGHIDIAEVQLNWLQGQQFKGIHYKDSEGKMEMEIESLSTKSNLWSIFTQNLQMGLMQINNLQLVVMGTQNSNHQPEKAQRVPVNEVDSSSPIIFSHVNANFDFKRDNQTLFASLKGLTQLNDLSGSFEVEFTLKGITGSTWETLTKELLHYVEKKEINDSTIRIKLRNFPTHLADRLSSFKNPKLNGIFQDFFGDHLDLNINKEPSQTGSFKMTAQAPRFQANIKGKTSDGFLIVDEHAIMDWSLSPSFFNSFSPPNTQLLMDVPMKVVIPYLSIPFQFLMSKGTTDFYKCGFNIDLILPKTDIHVSRIGIINVHNLKAHLDSTAESSKFLLKIVGEADYYQKPSTINYEIRLSKPADFYAFLHIFSRI